MPVHLSASPVLPDATIANCFEKVAIAKIWLEMLLKDVIKDDDDPFSQLTENVNKLVTTI